MGLQYGRTYSAPLKGQGLRYGHLMVMADQDHDGSHIKGLVLNFLHHFWPSLLATPGFLREFITPIVKATPSGSGRGGKSALVSAKVFYTLPEYTAWRESGAGCVPGWATKYYKGLGTSTAAEAKEYFSNISTHQIDFEMDHPEQTGHDANDLIDLAFSKKRADDRKAWLKGFQAGTHVDFGVERMLVSDFINKELILFSMADNVRSIPSAIDGLKPAQRKVLFACFKRNLRSDIKVAQLAGYVSEHSSYHHGEAALAATIQGMAQTFVGSNNVNLLVPSGQFGTRLMGGKDAASPRYIFTRLAPIARAIFHPADDALLTYLEDDGQAIEPVHYVPVIPMALVNGAEGIGTGWSTSVPNHSPRALIAALRARIRGEPVPENAFVPWYRGFAGSIVAKSGAERSFVVSGVARATESEGGSSILTITELPIGRWTQDYKQMLVSFVTGEKFDAKAETGGVSDRKGRGAAGSKSNAAGAKAVKGAAGAKKSAGKGAAQVAYTETAAKPAPRKAKLATKVSLAATRDDDEDVDLPDDGSDFEAEDEDDDDDEDEGGSASDEEPRKARPKGKAASEKEAFAALLPPPGEPLVKDFAENHTDTRVSFTISTTPAAARLMATCSSDGSLSAAVRKVFKLEGSISTSNMHLFDARGSIRRYALPEDVLDEFFGLRLDLYSRRKAHLIATKGAEVEKLANKARFISAVLAGSLRVANRKRAELLAELHDAGYKGYDLKEGEGDDDGAAKDSTSLTIGLSGAEGSEALLARRYAYLLSLPLWSLTAERVAALRAELAACEDELRELRSILPEAMWLRDLDGVEAALDELEASDAAADVASAAAIATASAGARKGKGTGAGSQRAQPRKQKAKQVFGSDESEGSDDGDFIAVKAKAPKLVSAKPVSAKAASVATTALPAPVQQPPKAPALAASTGGDSDDGAGPALSLAERLAQRLGGGGSASSIAAPIPTAAIVFAAKKASRPAKSPAVSPTKFSPEPKRNKKLGVGASRAAKVAPPAVPAPAPAARPARAAAAAASKHFKEHDGEDEDDVDDDDGGEESDFDDE